MILVLSLLGALVGHLFLRLPGFFFGALIFGLIGTLVGSAGTKIETIVRIRGRDAELYFLHYQKRPDALRIELSETFRAIDNALLLTTAELICGGLPVRDRGLSTEPNSGKLRLLVQQGFAFHDVRSSEHTTTEGRN
jgi:hypothetical protein